MSQTAPSPQLSDGPAPAAAALARDVQVRDVTVQYGAHVALEGASVTFRPGELSAVIGPNGAGKSTLLKALLGMVPIQSGTVDYGGGGLRAHAAYVPQQQTLDWAFPVTVWDVAMMGRTGRLGWGRRPGAADRALVEQALYQTELWDLRHRHIAALSGGQRQRALLARMLVRGGDVLLLDEPLTGVDTATSQAALELLRAQAAAGRAVVMVTHDLEQAAAQCHQLALVNRRVIASGTPAEVYTAANIEATFSASHLAHTHAEA